MPVPVVQSAPHRRPAGVGTTRPRCAPASSEATTPLVRGRLATGLDQPGGVRAAPAGRGRRDGGAGPGDGRRATPAGAESTPPGRGRASNPCRCGDDRAARTTPSMTGEQPPLARGRQGVSDGEVAVVRATPAGAGTIAPEGPPSRGPRRYPRRRGDDTPGGSSRSPSPELPPRTRGRHLMSWDDVSGTDCFHYRELWCWTQQALRARPLPKSIVSPRAASPPDCHWRGWVEGKLGGEAPHHATSSCYRAAGADPERRPAAVPPGPGWHRAGECSGGSEQWRATPRTRGRPSWRRLGYSTSRATPADAGTTRPLPPPR